jgi:GPH family glycoside/pentoside/hexuronide:cation symporter
MAEQQELHEEIVPLKSRVWVSAADAACAMLNTFVVSVGLSYYFTSFRGLEAGLAATAWLIFAIWNAVNDPLFGYLSDRTKSPLGRRIPYIRYGAPLIGLSFVLCWINFGGAQAGQAVMFAQMVLLLFIFDSLYTAIATSLYVMPYEMAVSNKARSSIFIWKLIFAVFPLAVPLVLWGIIKPEPGSTPFVFQMIMLAFGVVMAAVIFFSSYFYKEMHFQQEEQQPHLSHADFEFSGHVKGEEGPEHCPAQPINKCAKHDDPKLTGVFVEDFAQALHPPPDGQITIVFQGHKHLFNRICLTECCIVPRLGRIALEDLNL